MGMTSTEKIKEKEKVAQTSDLCCDDSCCSGDSGHSARSESEGGGCC